MKKSTKYVLGTITIVGVVGFSAYAIRTYKIQKKQLEEEITVEDARAEIEAYRESIGMEGNDIDGEIKIVEPIIVKPVKGRDDKTFNEIKQMSFLDDDFEDYPEDDYEDEEEEEEDYEEVLIVDEEAATEEIDDTSEVNDRFYEDLDLSRPFKEYMTEEDLVLKHEPSSINARNQFIRMELAEWAPMDDTHLTMTRLFDFPFNPKNEGDNALWERLADRRAEFFTEDSKWVEGVSLADVIIYYAQQAEFNVGESVKYWVEYFLEFNEFYHSKSSVEFDRLIERLSNHDYYNEEMNTYTLFGLTSEHYENAVQTAQLSIDQKLTYQIEFNEFLKSCF